MDEIRADAAIVQQHGALRGRAIPGDGPAVLHQPSQQGDQAVAVLRHRAGEPVEPRRAGKALLPLAIDERPDGGRVLARAGGRGAIDPDGAAVDGHGIDANDRQAGRLVQPGERRHREVAEVLVVDRVVFQPIEKLPEIGHLDDHEPVLGQQVPGPAEEALRVVHVGEDVVPDDGPRRSVGGEDLAGGVGVEEAVHRVDGVRAREGRDVRGRLDAEGSHAERPEPLEQASVVAADLDDEVAGLEAQKARHLVRVRGVMGGHRLRGAGDVDVVTEQRGGVDDVQELDECASLAEVDVEREERLGRELLMRPEEAVGERLRAERQDAPDARATAPSASGTPPVPRPVRDRSRAGSFRTVHGVGPGARPRTAHARSRHRARLFTSRTGGRTPGSAVCQWPGR